MPPSWGSRRFEPPPLIEPPDGSARDFSAQFAYSLDFWWVYLFYLGAVPAAVSLARGILDCSLAGAPHRTRS